MTFHNPRLVTLVSELFGFPRSVTHGKKDIEYNCPRCDNGRNKFNLVVDVDAHIFHCWACGYKGRVNKLFSDHGNPRQIDEYKLIGKHPHFNLRKEEAPKETLSLSSFRSLKYEWSDSLNYRAALKYLKERNIGQELIEKWDICYAENGKYKDRIIIPSRSPDGQVDYFVARDFYGVTKAKYKNPQLKKEELIFGEKFIDWKKPIFITEGVFDAIVIYNAIPILGTNIRLYRRLLKKLMKNRSTVILGFDPDKVGIEKERKVAKYLMDIGCTVYILQKKMYNNKDLSEIYRDDGKSGIIKLIKSAEPFDELDAAIASL